jgi:hypothetical protein
MLVVLGAVGWGVRGGRPTQVDYAAGESSLDNQQEVAMVAVDETRGGGA